MKKVLIKQILFVLLLSGILLSCSKNQYTTTEGSRYTITDIKGTRILMDSSWEAKVNPETRSMVDKYKKQLDDQMNEVIGEATETMRAATPQSLLTNLTADVMKQAGEKYTNQPIDFAVCNIGGHRAILAEGPITVGNMFEIYSFDNLLVILELEGRFVKKLFEYYASNGGEGVSADVQLKINNKKIEYLFIGKQPVEDNKIYRIAALDYLADGNSGMTALTKAAKTIDTGIALRDIMIEYVRKCTAEGKKIGSKLDNRIVIEE